MKKILAGVLAGASLLTMTTSAFASEKKVAAAGDVEYDVAATTPKVVLNLIMPAKMSAALNPYGADIKLQAKVEADADAGIEAQNEVATTVGIASAAYKITNMSTDYGVIINASATTTVTAAKGETWAVKTTAPADGVKGAQMALITAADAEALKTVAEADLADGEGVMLLDSAKTVSKKEFVKLGGASVDETGDEPVVTGTSAVIGFAGRLAKSGAKDVEWTEEDAINVALVLKVVAGPKGEGGSGDGDSEVTVTAETAVTALTLSDDGSAGLTMPTFAKDTASYTIAGCSRNDTFTFSITLESGYSYTIDDKSSNISVTGDTVKVGNTTGTNEVDIVVVNDADSTDTTTYTFTFAA